MKKQNTRFFSGGIKALLSGMLVVLMLGSAAASATEVDPNYVPPPVYTSGDYSYYINEDKTSVTICGVSPYPTGSVRFSGAPLSTASFPSASRCRKTCSSAAMPSATLLCRI